MSSVTVNTIAEGLHKAMCYAPLAWHNRLACPRAEVYVELARVVLDHPAMVGTPADHAPTCPAGGTGGWKYACRCGFGRLP